VVSARHSRAFPTPASAEPASLPGRRISTFHHPAAKGKARISDLLVERGKQRAR
jgi:hypothetical protein